jgi:hypothetical protein
MGGVGSGGYYRFGSKDRVEDHLSIDVRSWHRSGLLEPLSAFTTTWSRYLGEPSISVVVLGVTGECANAVRISYFWGLPGSEKEDIAYRVPIDWTACNFGGRRPWFVCPGLHCGRRSALLYLSGGYFLCRRCQELSYASQRERDSSVPALHRCQRIRTKLGGSPNMREPFPDKPKGMHWKTYWRMYERHEVAWAQYVGALTVEVGRISSRLDAIADRGS